MIHANFCFVREIQIEYKPNTNRIQTEYKPNTDQGEAEICMMVRISRTKQRVACIILMPILCRNQPPLNTPMPDKSTDMHFTARVHWCMHPCTCAALALCHCTCTCISSASGGRMVQWFMQSKHCGFDPRRVRFHTSFFSFSISGWLPTAKCVCLSTCGGEKKEKKKKGIVTGQNQPLRAVWCNTRLLNSGGQTCNLFGGAIPAQGLC